MKFFFHVCLICAMASAASAGLATIRWNPNPEPVHPPQADPMKQPPFEYPVPKQPSWWPGLVAILVLAFIIVMLVFSTGCASTVLYRDGKRIARFDGDMTGVRYVHNKDGSCELTGETIDHSSATLAQGQAASQKIAAAGAAVAVSGLTYLIK